MSDIEKHIKKRNSMDKRERERERCTVYNVSYNGYMHIVSIALDG